MDWKEDLADFLVWNVGLLVALVAVISFWCAYRRRFRQGGKGAASGWLRGEFSDLFARQIVWIFLLIECSVFILSWPVFRLTQCMEVAMDYGAYAAPCLAGIFAGLAVMYKKDEEAEAVSTSSCACSTKDVQHKENSSCAPKLQVECGCGPDTENACLKKEGDEGAKGKSSLGFTREYVFYIFSLFLLMAGYASYVWVHFSYSTVTWLIFWTSVAMTVGYFVMPTRRWLNHPRGFSEPVTLGIGVVLMFLLGTFGWFIRAEKAVYSSADAEYIHHACKNE